MQSNLPPTVAVETHTVPYESIAVPSSSRPPSYPSLVNPNLNAICASWSAAHSRAGDQPQQGGVRQPVYSTSAQINCFRANQIEPAATPDEPFEESLPSYEEAVGQIAAPAASQPEESTEASQREHELQTSPSASAAASAS